MIASTFDTSFLKSINHYENKHTRAGGVGNTQCANPS